MLGYRQRRRNHFGYLGTERNRRRCIWGWLQESDKGRPRQYRSVALWSLQRRSEKRHDRLLCQKLTSLIIFLQILGPMLQRKKPMTRWRIRLSKWSMSWMAFAWIFSATNRLVNELSQPRRNILRSWRVWLMTFSALQAWASALTPSSSIIIIVITISWQNLRWAGYLKKVVEKLKEQGADEEKVKAFQNGAQNYYTKHIAPNFKDFDFYTGESMDPDGMYGINNSPPFEFIQLFLSSCLLLFFFFFLKTFLSFYLFYFFFPFSFFFFFFFFFFQNH